MSEVATLHATSAENDSSKHSATAESPKSTTLPTRVDDVATPVRSTSGAEEPSGKVDPLEIARQKKDGMKRLGHAVQARNGTAFDLPLASLLVLCGEPGIHDYGNHRVDTENGAHTVDVEGADAVKAFLGDSPAAATLGRLTLKHDGAQTAQLWTERAQGQSSLAESLTRGAQPDARSAAAAAAAAEAAVASSKDPFVIDSDSDAEAAGQAEPPGKRQRN